MPSTYKTPGVYIEEISKFPPSVAPVATAIPAFIGYTQKAEKNGESKTLKPTSIRSLVEYEEIFGGAPGGGITVTLDDDNSVSSVSSDAKFYLYDSLRLFYDNGGGKCYIVSVGLYRDDSGSDNSIDYDAIKAGLDKLEKEDEPTLILSPDATLLDDDGLYNFQKQALIQCNKLQDRFTVCDLKETDEDNLEAMVKEFRDKIGVQYLKYGGAYTPWLKTSLSRQLYFRDLTLNLLGGAIANWSSFTSDGEILQILADLTTSIDVVGRATTDIGSIKNLKNGLIETPSANSLEERFKILFSTYADAATAYTPAAPRDFASLRPSIQGIGNKIRDILDAIHTLNESLPVEPAPDTDPPFNTGESKAYKLGESIASIIENNGLRDAFNTIAHHHNAIGMNVLTAGPDDRLNDAMVLLGYPDGTNINTITNTDISNSFADPNPDDPADDNSPNNPNSALIQANRIIEMLRSNYKLFIKAFLEIEQAAIEFESTLDNALEASFGFYKTIKEKVGAELNILPPSGAIVGVYSAVDNDIGVWKAPANVSLNSVVAPSALINREEQEDLNVDANGGEIHQCHSVIFRKRNSCLGCSHFSRQ